MRVEGATVVVTGAASGIGRALVADLLGRGARVVATDVDAEALAALGGELGAAAGALVAVPADVTDPEAVAEVHRRGREALGPAQVVVLNAGVAPSAPLLATSLATWRWVLDVNLMGVVHGLRAFLPDLVEQGRGHVAVVASLAGLAPVPDLAAYSASKHAVVSLAESVRLELGGTGIGVTTVCPGGVRTGIFHSERNRPGHLDAPTADEEAAAARWRARAGDQPRAPEDVAAEIVEAIEAGRAWLVPDQRQAAPVRQRLEAIIASAP